MSPVAHLSQTEIDFVELFDKFDPFFQWVLLERLLFFCVLVAWALIIHISHGGHKLFL